MFISKALHTRNVCYNVNVAFTDTESGKTRRFLTELVIVHTVCYNVAFCDRVGGRRAVF